MSAHALKPSYLGRSILVFIALEIIESVITTPILGTLQKGIPFIMPFCSVSLALHKRYRSSPPLQRDT